MTEPAFTSFINLAADRLGAETVLCSDDFFAKKENLLKPGRGIFIPGKYTDRGKWMDGWESRRKRTGGHDWCIIQLATPGIIHGVDIDTNHFLGNHPPHASIEACYIQNTKKIKWPKIEWKEILLKSPLLPGSQNFYEISDKSIYNHLRLNIFPDGGVARLKVYGEVFKDWKLVGEKEKVDLAAATNGARAILCNDMFFSHMDNLIMPGRGINMGDGWETKRNRIPGNHDWVIVRLAHEGFINRVCIDTNHFKGNFPDSCLLEGCNISRLKEGMIDSPEIKWTPILPKSKLSADQKHSFKKELDTKHAFTHVRLSIFPDGGISRMKILGTIKK